MRRHENRVRVPSASRAANPLGRMALASRSVLHRERISRADRLPSALGMPPVRGLPASWSETMPVGKWLAEIVPLSWFWWSQIASRLVPPRSGIGPVSWLPLSWSRVMPVGKWLASRDPLRPLSPRSRI